MTGESGIDWGFLLALGIVAASAPSGEERRWLTTTWIGVRTAAAWAHAARADSAATVRDPGSLSSQT